MSDAAQLGDFLNPFKVAPEGWLEHGFTKYPYGVFCACAGCGLVARSTFTFDFYAEGAGKPLKCESCEMRGSWDRKAAVEFQQGLAEAGHFDAANQSPVEGGK